MEWLVHSFENCEQGKLPMWMILTEIYWKDLLKLRKYGRRLVTTLVRHHHEVSPSFCCPWIMRGFLTTPSSKITPIGTCFNPCARNSPPSSTP